MNEIRIAVICPGLGVVRRGIETVVKEIFFRLSDNQKYKIDIFCGIKKKNIKNIKAHKNVNIVPVYIPEFNTFFSLLYKKIARKLRLLAQEQWDYNFLVFSIFLLFKLFSKKYNIIFNNGGNYCADICGIYRKVFGVPYIHYGHAGINSLEFSLAKKKPDIYIAATEPAENWIKKMLPELKTTVIPHGIDSQKFKPEKINETDLNLPKLKRPVYLFVGALTDMKQPDKVLQAFIDNNIGSLIIIGSGYLKPKILNIAKKNNLDKRRFNLIELVDYDKIRDYYNICDYFVMPSQQEAFGMVYLEAMACNKPVIAENNSAQKWLINNAGLFCNSQDINDIQTKMIEITKTDFKDLPIKNTKRFVWENIIQKYEKLIHDVIKRTFRLKK